MELKDTVELMTSDDYKERFKAEYYQLKIRYEKLQMFINKIKLCAYDEFHALMPEHDCPLGLLEEQLDYMKDYLDVLQQRAFAEKVEMENSDDNKN